MKNTIHKELKPCPFCGCKKISLDETSSDFIVAECIKCGAKMYSVKSFIEKSKMSIEEAKNEVINLWNHRTPLPNA